MNNPNKPKFETPDLTAENIAKLAALFPGVVAEGKVNVDLLRSYVGEEIFKDEAYEFTWVGKRAAIAEAGRLSARRCARSCRTKPPPRVRTARERHIAAAAAATGTPPRTFT